jgi:prephenate dehydratase/prephenate dehydrogenase
LKESTIGIIGGNGRMGKYFASFFERNGYKVIISGRKTPLTNTELAKKADVVIVSVPIDKTEQVIEEVAPHIKKSGLLMDLTSLKVLPMKIMEKAKASYLGCHPMFGPTANFEGQLVILCPGNSEKWYKWLKDIFEKNKATVKSMSAEKHDELMAYIQALTHFSDIALADTLRKSGIPIKEFADYQSPVYRLELDMMGRILNQDPNLYANIQIYNPLSKKVLNQFIESCQDLAKNNEINDVQEYVDYFKRCAEYLGGFCGTAMDESDRVLRYLGAVSEKSATCDKDIKYDIAVLGPKNTFSDTAVRKYRPKAEVYYAPSIHDIFNLIGKGKIKEGFVPIENSLTGSVRETMDGLYDSNVYIEKVIAQPIHLALIGIKKIPTNKIRTIYSHSQPLLQSQGFIRKNCNKAACIPVASTTAALERVAREKQADVCAIASPLAAKAYGLTVIRDSIEDFEDNMTYFAVIRKNSKPAYRTGRLEIRNPKGRKISIAFNFDKDSPGSLFTFLKDFADNKINMTKIESRPSSKIRGEYVFYIDFEGDIKNAKVRQTLAQIKKKVARLKVLGCY